MYKCPVTGMVTDNEKKLETMSNNLNEHDQNLIVYGCSAHWLNILEDFTPSTVISEFVEINKFKKKIILCNFGKLNFNVIKILTELSLFKYFSVIAIRNT